MIYYPQSAVTLGILWEDWDGKVNLTDEVYELVAVPKDLEIEINSYKEADTARITLDYKNFPFDPRSIRSLKVTCHIADLEKLFDAQGNPTVLSPVDVTQLTDQQREKFEQQLRENTVFAGFADESTMEFNDGAREIVIEARDQTSLLIDTKYPRTTTKLDQPFFDTIRSVLDTYESTQHIKIEARPASLITSTPIIASASSDINDATKNTKPGESMWDYIVDLCNRVALIPFIELDKLVITEPRILYTDSNRSLFTWGHNLRTLRFKRKLGRNKGINIEVRSLNELSKEVISVKYPEDSPGGKAQTIPHIVDGENKTKVAPYHVFLLKNIVNSDILLKQAENIWNEMARQEMEGSLSTKEMLICMEGKDERTKVDHMKITDVKMGTPIEVQIEAEDAKVLGTLEGRGVDAMRKYLVSRCYPTRVADAISQSYELMRKTATPYYTTKARLTVNQSGFQADIDFINFIEIDKNITGTAVPKGQSL
jgi:prophage tail gpP-like protein